MATYYARQFVGVEDGTVNPPLQADGRLVGHRKHGIVASKVAAQAWAAGDKIYIGKVRQGESLREIRVTTDTTLGTTTIAVGTLTTPAKYVAARTFTTPLDAPTAIGPLASIADDDPLTADEDIYVTLAVGGVAGGVNITFEMELAGLN